MRDARTYARYVCIYGVTCGVVLFLLVIEVTTGSIAFTFVNVIWMGQSSGYETGVRVPPAVRENVLRGMQKWKNIRDKHRIWFILYLDLRRYMTLIIYQRLLGVQT
jgi:hypothetical protein